MNVTIIATDSKKLPWQLNDIFLTAQHYNDMHPSKDYLQTILVRIPKGSLTEAEIHNAKQSALVTATAFRGRFITELNVSFGE